MKQQQNPFDISVNVNEKAFRSYGEQCLRGRITIGEFSETLHIPIEVWGIENYFKQWKEALVAFSSGAPHSYLVTGMRDLAVSGFIEMWVLYRECDNVVFQNQIISCDYENTFTGANFNDFIEPREQFTDEGEKVSEWILPCSAISEFLLRFGGENAPHMFRNVKV